MNGFPGINSLVFYVCVDSAESFFSEKPACIIAFLALNKTSEHLSVVVGHCPEVRTTGMKETHSWIIDPRRAGWPACSETLLRGQTVFWFTVGYPVFSTPDGKMLQ